MSQCDCTKTESTSRDLASILSDLACNAVAILRPIAYEDKDSWFKMMRSVATYIGDSVDAISEAHSKGSEGAVIAMCATLCEEFSIHPSLWRWEAFSQDTSPQKAKKYAALADKFCTGMIDPDGWDTEQDDDDDEGTYGEIRSAFSPPVLYESDGTCGDEGPEIL